MILLSDDCKVKLTRLVRAKQVFDQARAEQLQILDARFKLDKAVDELIAILPAEVKGV